MDNVGVRGEGKDVGKSSGVDGFVVIGGDWGGFDMELGKDGIDKGGFR